jgi:hypothetical protein
MAFVFFFVFQDKAPKSQEMETTIKKWNCIKLKKVWQSKRNNQQSINNLWNREYFQNLYISGVVSTENVSRTQPNYTKENNMN